MLPVQNTTQEAGGSMALERELETFRRDVQRLLQEGKRGQFALVHGDAVDSTWNTIDEASEKGYERFGLEPFLVKEITDHEEPQYFSRSLKPCR